MSIGLPVAQNNMTDNMKDLPSNYYENIINFTIFKQEIELKEQHIQYMHEKIVKIKREK